MTTVNIFELATRQKLKFTSVQGELTVEDLWDLPLASERPAKASLNTVAQAIDNAIGQSVSKNFVDDTPAVSPTLGLKLDIVKHIIAVKKAENAAKAASDAAKRELEAITEALAGKNADAIKNMSAEELQARAAALRAQIVK